MSQDTSPTETREDAKSAAGEQPSKPVWRVGTLTYTAGGLAVLFGWLLWGDFAWQIRERSVAPVMMVLLQKFEASALVISLLLASLPAVLSVIISPIISYKSDRHRGPRGRRIPFLLLSTPFAALSLFLMAATPWLGSGLHAWLGDRSPGESACSLLALGIAWTIFEAAAMVCNTLFGALINDVVPKEMIGRFYGLFRACSLLAGILFNKVVFAHADEHYTAIFAGVGLVFGVGFTLMCLRVKEGDYPPPAQAGASEGFFSACRTYFRECGSNRYYISIFLAYGFGFLAFIPINTYSVAYADSVGMSRQSFGDHVALTYMISLVLAYFLGWMSDKFHPLRMSIASIALYIVVMVFGALTASGDAEKFGVALVAHGVVSGMFFTTTASLGARLYPQVRFAQVNSAGILVVSLMSAIFPPFLGKILDLGGRHYGQTFYWGAGLAVIALTGFIYVHSHWLKLGGSKDYKAP